MKHHRSGKRNLPISQIEAGRGTALVSILAGCDDKLRNTVCGSIRVVEARANQSASERAIRVIAWVLAVVALYLSLSGWFTWFGLALAVPTMILARAERVGGAFITAAAAACVTGVWALIGLTV